MPTYVYKFVKSGETIEVAQAFDEPTLEKLRHPRTGRLMAVKKVFQPVGVTFKGGGFYKTDSRSGSTGSKAAAKDSTGSSDSSDSTASTDSSSSSSDSASAAASTGSEPTTKKKATTGTTSAAGSKKA